MKTILGPGLALALALGASLPAFAQNAPTPPSIVVTGEGEATLAPDIAEVSLAVSREAPTAREALTQNSTAMAEVIKALKDMGIESRDLQTSGVQVSARYDYISKPDNTQESRLRGYDVTNTLNIRVRDVGKTGEVIDRAVSLGVNEGGNISFTNENPKPAMTDARKKAVADAMDKARTLAEAAGVKLGRVMEISDTVVGEPPRPMLAKAFAARDAAPAPAPVEAGENAYRVQVNMTFALEP
ncbi:MAG: SIMPL domain-containing protein [Methylobacterium mesophilicum]|nr:SIMPL domain-containing protein [Methylobacterium mesophilicum]